MLIECFLRDEKQHKQMKTPNKTAGTCSIFNRFNTCEQTTVSVHQELVYVSLAEAYMTSLVYAGTILPSISLCALHLSLDVSALILFYHHSVIRLCIRLPPIFLFQFICSIFPSFTLLSALIVHIVVLTHLFLSLSPSSLYCMQVTMAVGEAAQQYKAEKRK